MKKQEKYLLSASTPDEWVERCLKSRLTHGRKTALSRKWCKETGYTSLDIAKARNKNKMHQKRRSLGYQERNKKRWELHNYKDPHQHRERAWPIKKVYKFIELNAQKGSSYLHPDHQIARTLHTTIPSVQYWRRKHNLCKYIMKHSKQFKLISLLRRSEWYLIDLKQSIESKYGVKDQANYYKILSKNTLRKL